MIIIEVDIPREQFSNHRILSLRASSNAMGHTYIDES